MIRLASSPTSTNSPERLAETMWLKVNVLRLEPTPSCHHSTLIPVLVSTMRFRENSESFVECSR